MRKTVTGVRLIIASSLVFLSAQIALGQGWRWQGFHSDSTMLFTCEMGYLEAESYNAWYNNTGRIGKLFIGNQSQCQETADKLQTRFARITNTEFFAICDGFAQLHFGKLLTNGSIRHNKSVLYLPTSECSLRVKTACYGKIGKDVDAVARRKAEATCNLDVTKTCKAEALKTCQQAADKMNASKDEPKKTIQE